MVREKGRNVMDGKRDADAASDPEAEITEEPPIVEEEIVDVTGDVSNLTDSVATNLQQESVVGGKESEPPSTVEMEGVILNPNYNVLGRIVLEEADTREELEVEEEELVLPEPTVITLDCIEGANDVEIVEEGLRRMGTFHIQGDLRKLSGLKPNESLLLGKTKVETKCPVKKSPFFRQQEEVGEVTWTPDLNTANTGSSYFEPPTDELARSLSSSKTYILKSRFDSCVLHGLGETVIDRYTLCNDRIEIDVINLGARVTAVRIFDGGKWVDVALGLDNAAGYLSSTSDYMGATIGRVADKICNGKFRTPCAHEFHLSKNDGEDHYNGGFQGLHKRMWEVERRGDSLAMLCKCYDKEEGYPGNLKVLVSFSLSGDMSFNVDYCAKADSLTPANITNAIYFNLAGHNTGRSSLYGHSVFVNSEAYCEPGSISEGKLELVYDSPYNLTDFKHLGCVMKKDGGKGLEVNFAIYRKAAKQVRETDPAPRVPMKIAAIAHDEKSGRTLVVRTNQWGLRLYTCNRLQDTKGKDGAVYQRHCGFCLQPGNLPNAVNIEHFPEIFLAPQDSYKHSVHYSFSIDRGETRQCKTFLGRTPWLLEEDLLRCKLCSRGEAVKEESKGDLPFKKTYLALEKLAEQTSRLDEEDEDSLSIHSSFTSFGSDSELILLQGNTGVNEIDLPQNQEEGRVMKDESECVPKLVVSEPDPLPPYLTGKWPRTPLPPQLPKEVPQRKLCPPTSAFLSALPKGQDPAPSGQGKALYPARKKQEDLKQVSQKVYSPVKLGLLGRVDQERSLCGADATLSIPLELNLQEISDFSLESGDIRNPVLGRSGDCNFPPLGPIDKLPWYSSSLPTSKKMSGKMFTLLNFQQNVLENKSTEAEIVEMIDLRNKFIKSLSKTIRYSPGEVILYQGGTDLLSDSDTN